MNEALKKAASVFCPCIEDTVKLTECSNCIDNCQREGCTYGCKDKE